MANLTGQNIKDTYQQLVTLGSGTTITNGTGSQITNLAVTSSWAQNAVTASYALNAGVTVNTGSLMVTGSVSGNVLTFTKGDGSAFNLTVNTGSGADVTALSASLSTRLTIDENNISSALSASNSNAANIVTLNNILATTVVTASAAANVITFTKADASTFNVTVSQSGSVATASLALDAEKLGGQVPGFYTPISTFTLASASYSSRVTTLESEVDSLQAATSSYASATSVTNLSSSLASRLTTDESNISANTSRISSLTAATSSYALKTEVSGAFASVSSSFASRLTADEAIINSLVAATASYAKINTNNTFTGTQTFDNITVNGTASIAVLNYVTGSATYIGDSFVVVNTDLPAQRYAGIAVFDSGSSPAASASLEWDGLTDVWLTKEETGNTAVVLTGPTGSRGAETFPTANKLQKGLGWNYLGDSNITDDGSVVSIGSRVNVTGAVTASAGFSGNLVGNASTATSASFATYANTAGSATSSTSASYATFALTASYALNGGGGGTGEATQETGNLLFANIYGEIYGSAASPVTGNLTISGVSTKLDGAVAVVFHTGSSEPTVSGGTIVKKTGNYSSTLLNVLTFTNIDGTNYIETIAGAGVTSVDSASFATFAATAATATSATSASFATFANTAGSTTTAATASYVLNAVSASFASTASYVTGQAEVASGDLQFTNILGEVYGSVASPVTGNLTISGASTKRTGAVAIVFHTGSSEPTVSGGTIAKKTGTYSSTALNILTFTNVGGGNYLEYIAGGVATSVDSASYATTASYAISAGSAATSTSASYATFAGSAGSATSATSATSASFATFANSAGTVTSASFASSATISNTVYNNNTSSGSIGFWQGTTAEYNAISGSASNSIIYFVI